MKPRYRPTWWVTFLVVALVVVVGVGVIARVSGAGSWDAVWWAAWAQMLATVVALVGLGGLYLNFEELREQTRISQATREPIFTASTVRVAIESDGRLSVQGDPSVRCTYVVTLRNDGGIAYHVSCTMDRADEPQMVMVGRGNRSSPVKIVYPNSQHEMPVLWSFSKFTVGPGSPDLISPGHLHLGGMIRVRYVNSEARGRVQVSRCGRRLATTSCHLRST